MKKIIIAALFISIQLYLFSIKINIANLNIYTSELDVELNKKDLKSSTLLFKYLKRKDFEGHLNIKQVSKSITYSDKLTKSTLDASELCELLNIDFLLYGFIEKTNKYYNAEVRLFENENKIDKKSFFVKNDTDDIDVIIEELADKIFKYLNGMLGYSDTYDKSRRGFGGIGIYTGVGYWFPMGDWWSVLTGLVCFEHGVNVIPITPIVDKRNFNFYLRYGFYISYSLGMNKPNYLTSYFNSIILKIPAEVCFEIYNRNVFIVSFGPQLQIDILYQELLFADPETTVSPSFSLTSGVGYEYWFGERKLAGIGVNNIFDFTFYSVMFYDYKLQFYSICRIPIKENLKEKLRKEILEELQIEIQEKREKEKEAPDNTIIEDKEEDIELDENEKI